MKLLTHCNSQYYINNITNNAQTHTAQHTQHHTQHIAHHTQHIAHNTQHITNKMTHLCKNCRTTLSQNHIKNRWKSCGPCYKQSYKQTRFRVTKTITEPSCEVSKCVYYPYVNKPQNLNILKSEINYEYNSETCGYCLTTYCYIISEWDQRTCKWVDIYEVS